MSIDMPFGWDVKRNSRVSVLPYKLSMSMNDEFFPRNGTLFIFYYLVHSNTLLWGVGHMGTYDKIKNRISPASVYISFFIDIIGVYYKVEIKVRQTLNVIREHVCNFREKSLYIDKWELTWTHNLYFSGLRMTKDSKYNVPVWENGQHALYFTAWCVIYLLTIA